MKLTQTIINQFNVKNYVLIKFQENSILNLNKRFIYVNNLASPMNFLKNVFIKVLKLYNSMLDFNAGIQTQLYADQQSSQDLFFWLAWSRCHKHKHNLLTLPLIISVT